MNRINISFNDKPYPKQAKEHLKKSAPKIIGLIGNTEIFSKEKVAIFCSVRCPGKEIIKTYDFIQEIRNNDIAVISGFHSPVEKECFNILARGTCSIIVCLARSLPKRIPSEYQQLIKNNRMLLISPFSGKNVRITKETSHFRNLFSAALADKIYIPYAEKNSKTEDLYNIIKYWKTGCNCIH